MYNKLKLEQLLAEANLLAKNNNWGAEAIDLNKKILEIDKQCSMAYTRLGRCYKEQGNIQEAMNVYKAVLEFDKDNTIARNNVDHYEYNRIKEQNRMNEENRIKEQNRINVSVPSARYINHCYVCRSQVTDAMARCEQCNWYICNVCGACGCGYNK